MREAQNIREVESLSPSMMGFICWDGSPRHVASAPPYLPACIRVGVFVDPTLEYIQARTAELKLDRVQLHGRETPERCRQVAAATGLPVIKALSVRTREDIEAHRPYQDAAHLLLFDTKCPTVGGSGRSFDWDVLQHYDGALPFLLAGGIGPDDAERVRRFRHPRFAGIDLNSRFEVSAGRKDPQLLRKFLNTLHA